MERLVSKAFWVMVIFLSVSSFSFAEDKATKEECVAKCKEAAAMIKEAGPEAAFAKISDPKGQFAWKDSYVFCCDMESAEVKAHPIKPKLIGQQLKGLKDVNGKLFFVEIINVAKEKGEGWVSYMWPKPGSKEPSPKSTYALRVEGTSLIVCAGINE